MVALVVDHIDVIASESQRLIEILRAGPLDARVPGTPDWNLGELGDHMEGVQRWSTKVIKTGEPPQVNDGPAADNAADSLEVSYQALTAALGAADPEAPCWNFASTAPQVTSFWFRRQTNEIAIHRWDAESAISQTPPALDPGVAVEIIDEFVHIMLRRVIDREKIDMSSLSGDVHVHCTDAQGEWTFEIADGELVVVDEHRKAAVALRGTASDLALFLNNRISAETLETFGEDATLATWSPVFRF